VKPFFELDLVVSIANAPFALCLVTYGCIIPKLL
jgi:hypothetical protein